MPDERLNFILAARDNASATLARTNKELRALGGSAAAPASAFGRLSAVTGGLVTPTTLALGATAALTAGLASAVENARADQQSQRLLGAALEANIPNWEGNTDAIEGVIDSRLKLGFTDEAQRESLRQLVAQTKDSTKALELQRTAMDLARLRNIDLTTASTLLGKVYGGNIGILTRYGIQLEKGTTATEAIAEIQRRAAGQAEAWSEGLEGQTAALGIALDEASERVGYALVGPLTELVGFLNDAAIPALNSVIDTLGEVGDAVQATGDFFDDLHDDILRDTQIEIDPGEWARALHDFFRGSKDEAEQFSGAISDAATGMRTEWAQTWQAMPADMRAGYTAAQQAAAAGQADVTGAVVEGSEQAAQEAGKTPKRMADAMLANQFHLTPAVAELRQFMEDAIPPREEKMQLRAFLASRALERGLNSGIPAVRRKADEMRQAAQERLDALNGGPAGITAAQTYINGMATGIRAGVGVIDDALYYLKVNSIGGSLPRSGPMTGVRIAEGARSIANKFRDELGTGLRQGVSMSGLSLSGAMVGAGGMAGGGGGGVTLVINSMYPPSPAQLAEYARLQFPYLERERTRQQRRPD